MFIADADSQVFKKWVIKKLEDISDADSDVLADYVLALIRSDESDEDVRSNCVENLKDFLREDSEKFVNEVFQAVKAKSYVPGYIPPSTLVPTAPAFNPPTRPSSFANIRPNATGFVNGANGTGFQSRKRTFNDREGNDGNDMPYIPGVHGERATKQMRRGGRGDGRGAQGQVEPFGIVPLLPGALNLMNAHAMPALDPSNPMSAILAFQAMNSLLGLASVPMPGAQSPITPTFGAQGTSSHKKGKRCFDYDAKGFCARGSSCPYEHGTDFIANPGSGQTFNQALPTPLSQGNFPMSNGRSRAQYQSDNRNAGKNRGTRAPFSSVGRNMDRNVTTIVVESIPEENFSEEAVRGCFSEFGKITEVTMQPYKRLAVVKYDDYWSARNAYESPKTIFDNRFVKVYWYKPTDQTKSGPAKSETGSKTSPAPSGKARQEAEIDPAEIAKRLSDAQKAHEEKKRKVQEANAQKEELDKKMREQANAKEKLLEAIAAKEKTKKGADETLDSHKEAEESEDLKAKLAMLEAEAESLGLDPNDAYNSVQISGAPSYGYRGRARAGYRGRGGYNPRARGARGYGYRGRGASSFAAPRSGGSVMRLDNRPKRVVIGIGPRSSQDEALRQYLFNGFEFESIDPHPDRTDAQVVTFKERYLSEQFISSAPSTLGKVELGWFVGSLPSSSSGVTSAPPDKAADAVIPSIPVSDADVTMDEAPEGNEEVAEPASSGPAMQHGEQDQGDLDVADDEDRWVG